MLLLLLGIMGVAGTTHAEETVWTFNKWKVYQNTNLLKTVYTLMLPDGWRMMPAFNPTWQLCPAPTADGNQFIQCTSTAPTPNEGIIIPVKAGKLEFNVRKMSSGTPALELYNAVADGSDFTVGSRITAASNMDINATDFKPVTLDVEADGNVILACAGVQIDKITNSFEGEIATFTVKGKVENSGGVGLEDAEVTVGEQTVTTNALGEFTLTEVPSGAYRISARKRGFQDRFEDLTVDGADVNDFVIVMNQATTWISGTLFNAETGAFVEGATVMAYNEEGKPEGTISDAEGKFTIVLKGLVEGKYKLTYESIYYETITEEGITITEGDDNTFEKRLTPKKLTFSATVKDPEGQNVSGATVTISATGIQSRTAFESNEKGVYTITNISAPEAKDLEFTLNVEKEGYFFKPETFQFNGGDYTTTCNLAEASDVATVSGKVTDAESGAAIGGVSIELTAQGVDTVTATTAADGTYSINITGDVAASYKLTATKEGYDTYESTITDIKLGETAIVDIQMKSATGGINGISADAEGVVIYNLNGMRVKNENLPAGIYVVNGKKVIVK